MAIYMQYGSIEGDATAEGFEGWINLKTFTWVGVERTMQTKSAAGGAQSRVPGTPDVKDFKVTKQTDSASGGLLRTACSTDDQGETCKIAFLMTGDAWAQYLMYTFQNTLITHLDVTGSEDGGRPIESLTLNFTDIEIEVSPADPSNQLESPFHFVYHVGTRSSSG